MTSQATRIPRKVVFLQVRNPLTAEQQEIVRQHYFAHGFAPNTVFEFKEMAPESGDELMRQCQDASVETSYVHPFLTEEPLPAEAMRAGFVPLILFGNQLYYLHAVVPDIRPFVPQLE